MLGPRDLDSLVAGSPGSDLPSQCHCQPEGACWRQCLVAWALSGGDPLPHTPGIAAVGTPAIGPVAGWYRTAGLAQPLPGCIQWGVC